MRYYLLSLGLTNSRLYEGFRDALIDIRDEHFPFEFRNDRSDISGATLTTHLLATSEHFASYFRQDPLYLVLTGSRKYLLSSFKSVAAPAQLDALVGELEGDYSASSLDDVGKAAWLVVKRALAGGNAPDIRELSDASGAKTIDQGLDAVGRSAGSTKGSLLFVDEDYRVKIDRSAAAVLFPQESVDDVVDDAVDVVIEKVLAKGGNVVFLDSATMEPFQRIALLTHGPTIAQAQ